MIINALCDYYDILAENSDEIAKENYSSIEVNFAINLTKEGDISSFIDLRKTEEEMKGKKLVQKLVSQRMMVPEQKVRAGKNPPPYFLVDKSDYLLGINAKEVKKDYFEAFKNFHLQLLENSEDAGAKAIINFINKWQPDNALECLQSIQGFSKEVLNPKNIVFSLVGEAGYIHNRSEIQEIWQNYNKQGEKEFISQCLVTGENEVIAKIHPKIKGVWGAQSAGASLVSFNERAYESYGKDNLQAYNSPVSEKSAFKYSTILNYLLEKGSKQKIQIADATTVFWAQSEEPIYTDIISQLLNPALQNNPEENEPKAEADEKQERIIYDVLDLTRQGKSLSDINTEIKEETQSCILGLSPNNARLSVRFFYRDTFGGFIKKMNQHYEDLKIDGIPKNNNGREKDISINRILYETIVKQSKESASPLLSGNLLRSIITGSNYPFDLYTAILRRIKAEQDDKEKKIYSINYVRVAVIKAYLKRKYRLLGNDKYEEVLKVSLNEESTEVSYCLGRAFALLEKTQERALGDGINKTIKDSYFSSASSTPASVFPVLMKLNNHHLAKLDEKGKWLEIKIGEVMDKINGFPSHLNLEEQGLFILGYYHQRQSFFKKKDQSENVVSK